MLFKDGNENFERISTLTFVCLSFPETYVSRVKRDQPLVHDEEILDVNEVEKKLVSELGGNVCVYERICVKYANQTLRKRSRERALDWDVVFRYVSSTNFSSHPILRHVVQLVVESIAC